MSFNLDDYNTVPERMAEAAAKYPEGRFQSRIVELPAAFADKFIAVEGRYYRTADDPTPAYGLAWEPVPGNSNFTRLSELQNAETSAWGRALIAAFAADAKKGIASQEDVRNRQANPTVPHRTKTSSQPAETPQMPETGPTGPEVARLKNWLLTETGDIAKAKTIWRDTLAVYGLGPDEVPTAGDLSNIENDLEVAVKESLQLEILEVQ